MRSSILFFALLLTACPSPSDPDGGLDAATPDAGVDAAQICDRASACDDGDFCNGVETCEPGAEGADATGCVAGTPPCEGEQVCNEEADTCDVDCAEPDADMDGHHRVGCGTGDDCDDNDPDRYPGNPEVCDAEGHDEDCNPETLTGAPDADSDTYISAMCCNGETCGDDCDDNAMDVRPGATEVCNGVDDNCDGVIDGTVGGPGPVGAMEYFEDLDGDGFGNPDRRAEACTQPEGWVPDDRDCWDGSDLVKPGQTQYFDRPVCRNGAMLTQGPPGMCPGSDGDCWVCGDRRAEPGDYDYDCSGAAEPAAEVTCYSTGLSCRGGRGPDGIEPAAKCGLRVPFLDCRSGEFGGCDSVESEARLPCR